MQEMIVDYTYKRVFDHLRRRPYGRVLFLFDHGLGDLVNFMPLFESVKSHFPNCVFKIGVPEKRKYIDFHPSIIPLDGSFRSSILPYYQHIFKITYPEPSIEDRKNGIRKPYLCNQQEMGLPNFIWKPYQHPNFVYNPNGSVTVGLHFTGSTNPKQKNINFKVIEQIWKEIEEFGYIPFDVHMDCYTTTDKSYPSFITPNNSFRFKNINMKSLIYTIRQCKIFLGIDSGPFYLATSLLGTERCIFLENRMKIDWYFPYPIKVVDTKNYQFGDISNILENLGA